MRNAVAIKGFLEPSTVGQDIAVVCNQLFEFVETCDICAIFTHICGKLADKPVVFVDIALDIICLSITRIDIRVKRVDLGFIDIKLVTFSGFAEYAHFRTFLVFLKTSNGSFSSGLVCCRSRKAVTQNKGGFQLADTFLRFCQRRDFGNNSRNLRVVVVKILDSGCQFLLCFSFYFLEISNLRIVGVQLTLFLRNRLAFERVAFESFEL